MLEEAGNEERLFLERAETQAVLRMAEKSLGVWHRHWVYIS